MTEPIHKAGDVRVGLVGPFFVKRVGPLCGAPIPRPSGCNWRSDDDAQVTCEACLAKMKEKTDV